MMLPPFFDAMKMGAITAIVLSWKIILFFLSIYKRFYVKTCLSEKLSRPVRPASGGRIKKKTVFERKTVFRVSCFAPQQGAAARRDQL
jgi:hypothetical protein